MARKKRIEIKFKQKEKRRNRRRKLIKENKNPDEHFYDGYYVSKPLK